jgi:osmoprotectant transport system substrate-binding protein
MRIRRSLGVGATLAVLLATAACGGDSLEESDDSSGGDDGGSGGGSLTLSGQNFPEAELMAALYEQVLENAGYSVTTELVDTRDVYLDQLSGGQVDVVPEYLAGIADQLQIQANGEDAPVISSNDVDETMTALEKLATDAGITMLEPAEASDQNAFAVTTDFAEENDLTTLSDLAALGEPVKLAAAPDCEGRPDCEGGLEDVYGIDIEEIVPLGYGSAQTKQAVTDGEVQLGLVASTDGTLEELGLVVLEDDKGIQPAQNLVPAVNTEFLNEHPDVADVLNELSATLTTDELIEMNSQLDLERQKPADVAEAYLTDKGLI